MYPDLKPISWMDPRDSFRGNVKQTGLQEYCVDTTSMYEKEDVHLEERIQKIFLDMEKNAHTTNEVMEPSHLLQKLNSRFGVSTERHGSRAAKENEYVCMQKQPIEKVSKKKSHRKEIDSTQETLSLSSSLDATQNSTKDTFSEYLDDKSLVSGVSSLGESELAFFANRDLESIENNYMDSDVFSSNESDSDCSDSYESNSTDTKQSYGKKSNRRFSMLDIHNAVKKL